MSLHALGRLTHRVGRFILSFCDMHSPLSVTWQAESESVVR
jgi:hypothetical protein